MYSTLQKDYQIFTLRLLTRFRALKPQLYMLKAWKGYMLCGYRRSSYSPLVGNVITLKWTHDTQKKNLLVF